MNTFWGDNSWTQVVYSTTGNLFGWPEKTGDNDTVAQAFRDRLKTKAGFKHVPDLFPCATREERLSITSSSPPNSRLLTR